MRTFILLLMALLGSYAAMAQEFTTHEVQQGETLYGIARKYGVTPYSILKFNREVQKDEPLQPNTILVVPKDARAANMDLAPAAVVLKKNSDKKTQAEPEPLRFETHRVRRKETLFGIAQEYGITQDAIKRYNKELYSTPLKRGMRLQIPVYPEPETLGDLEEDDIVIHTVKPKETRWSIAHRYGITIDSLIALNPEMSAATSYLAEGQQIRVPRLPGSTVSNQEVEVYESYTVPAKKTLYSLSQEYDLPADQIVRLNPEIRAQGGLKQGMVIRLPKKKPDTREVNTENYVFYQVKPKQTTYSLTRNLGVAYSELLSLNPELATGLKAGMVLKIPKEKAFDLEVKNSLVLDKVNLKDSIDTSLRPKLMFLLPFRTDKVKFNDETLALKALNGRNDIKYSMGLYSGALVAIDSMARLGVSVDVYAFDNRLSPETTREILRRENLGNYSAIFGPLDQESFREVATQAARADVPVVAAVPVTENLNLSNVFFSQTPEALLRKRMLDYMKTQVSEENLIVISDAQHAAAKQRILEAFPQAKTLPVTEEEENISIDFAKLTEMLSQEAENWVFVETDNFKLVSSITSILNSSNREATPIRMFTTDHNRAWDNPVISGAHLSNLRFTFPSVYREVVDDAFVRRYKQQFNGLPDKYAVRGFDVTLDLLLKLAYRPNLFEASRGIGTTEYSGNKFNYDRDKLSGYYNTASYIMMYEGMQIKEVRP